MRHMDTRCSELHVTRNDGHNSGVETLLWWWIFCHLYIRLSLWKHEQFPGMLRGFVHEVSALKFSKHRPNMRYLLEREDVALSYALQSNTHEEDDTLNISGIRRICRKSCPMLQERGQGENLKETTGLSPDRKRKPTGCQDREVILRLFNRSWGDNVFNIDEYIVPPAAGCERLEKNIAVARDSLIQGCAGSGGHKEFAMLRNLTSRATCECWLNEARC